MSLVDPPINNPLLSINDCDILAMTYVGGYAGYNNLPIMGWLSDDSTFEDKNLYNSLVRAFGPINGIGIDRRFLPY